MMPPTCPPCTIENVDSAGVVLIVAALGVLAEAAGVLALKGADYLGSIRERRLRMLENRVRGGGPC